MYLFCTLSIFFPNELLDWCLYIKKLKKLDKTDIFLVKEIKQLSVVYPNHFFYEEIKKVEYGLS